MPNPLHITSVTVKPFTTPLHSPFVTSQGRATEARAVAVSLTLSDHQVVQGESVPVQYVTGETIESVVQSLQEIQSELIGLDVSRFQPVLDTLLRLLPNQPSTRCALEMACLDAWSLASGTSLHTLFGGAVEAVESDITIPIVANAGELAAAAWERGIRIFKIKVGDQNIADDHARVEAVRRAAPEAKFRIDANQAFSPEGALQFVETLLEEGVHLELLEQPVHANDFEGLAWVAERSPVPVFADESVKTPADALRLVATPVQGLNLKINKNGIGGVLDIIRIARAANRRLMLGCMLETRRSTALSLAIACGTGAFDHIDLDSPQLLNEPGDNPYFTQDGARMTLLS